ncbi:MarR family winged helix-turn-helix transcriptional regulator [Sporosarcina sp. 6E9]|uniref:MarR family winged helix-turn-helix transcriptional regulator n=1 Tax=Sporosarcina sp. 6E9 TaxID=2819235 RepID=UPI001B31474B|nr:MarR family transcriptional regulator [Sporosarcina sp. 6E9]
MEKNISIFHALTKNLNKIHKSSCEEITAIQSSILHEVTLHNNPSMHTVAEAIGMDITTFSRQIGTLAKKQLIIRTPDSNDRRILLLSLTQSGHHLIETINNRIAEIMGDSLSSMNEFERETVIRSLHLFCEKL